MIEWDKLIYKLTILVGTLHICGFNYTDLTMRLIVSGKFNKLNGKF